MELHDPGTGITRDGLACYPDCSDQSADLTAPATSVRGRPPASRPAPRTRAAVVVTLLVTAVLFSAVTVTASKVGR